jgi:hypothetical protein
VHRAPMKKVQRGTVLQRNRGDSRVNSSQTGGTVDLGELNEGFKRMQLSRAVKLSVTDFDELTEHGSPSRMLGSVIVILIAAYYSTFQKAHSCM